MVNHNNSSPSTTPPPSSLSSLKQPPTKELQQDLENQSLGLNNNNNKKPMGLTPQKRAQYAMLRSMTIQIQTILHNMEQEQENYDAAAAEAGGIQQQQQ